MENRLIAALALTFLGAFNSQLITARAQSPFGNAVSLDGVSQYVSVPTAAGSAVNSPLTIEAWVYVRAYASWSRLMDFGNGAAINNIVCVLSSAASGLPALYFFNGAGANIGSVTSPSTLPLNTWTHLAFTYDGTNGSIFINGNLATKGPMAVPPVATRTNNFIGRSNFSDPNANVILDEFRIWSVARSPAQILGSLGAPLVGAEAGLLLYYKFDSTSGTVATNSATATGAAYNGTLVNSPGWVPGPLPPSYLVTNISDAGAGSLRDAINTTPPGGLIYFDTNLSGQTITLTNGQLVVTNNLTIDASALTTLLTLSGAGSRLLLITNNATMVLNFLALYNGRAVGLTNNFGGGIYNSTNCTLTVTRCLLSGNSASGDVSTHYFRTGGNGSGGGMYNAGTVTLDNCTLSGNSASGGNSDNADPSGGGNGSGGGIYNAGTATLVYCNVSSNSASGGNGSSCCGAGGGAGNSSGGGIYNVGTLTLSNCALSTNSGNGGNGGNGGGGSGGPGAGGGRAAGGGVYNGGSLTLNQNTLSGNSTAGGGGGSSSGSFSGGAGGGAFGGGVYDAGTVTLNQNTLSGNSATGGNGGSSIYGGGATGAANGGGIYTTSTNAALHNCLIALNAGGGSPDLSGSFISQGHNLVGATNGSGGTLGGVNGDLAGTTTAPLNPLLSPLANHGGPTLTLALQPGSPAIDAGDDSVTNSFATDQRGAGFPRLHLQHVDIGAYEFGNGDFAPAITSLSAGSLARDPVSYLGSLTVGASVNPNAFDVPATAWVQYGVSTGYGLTTTPLVLGAGTSYVPLTQPLINLAPGLTWHYRWVAANFFGTNFSSDQTVAVGTLGGGVSGIVGDLNGDGIVSQAELDAVYANYVTNSPWLYMTNAAGLGGTNVSFSLSNSVLGAYSIQYSTNLVNVGSPGTELEFAL